MPDMSMNGYPCDNHDRRIQAVEVALPRQNKRHTEQMVALHSTVSRVETKVDRILEGIRIGAVVPVGPDTRKPLPSLDWSLDDATNPGVEGAATWKQRAAEVAEAKTRAEIALIEARARERRMTITAVAAAIGTVIAAAAAAWQML